MRRLLMVMVLLGSACSQIYAQSVDTKRNYDFEHPMYTAVDVATKVWFSGWSGDCNSGRIPMSFMLWRIDPDLTLHNVPVTLTTGPRPDAASYLAAVCNRPFDSNIGWSLVPKDPEPVGKYIYVILVTDLPTSWTCGTYPAGYPNAGQQWCDYVANVVYRIVQ